LVLPNAVFRCHQSADAISGYKIAQKWRRDAGSGTLQRSQSPLTGFEGAASDRGLVWVKTLGDTARYSLLDAGSRSPTAKGELRHSMRPSLNYFGHLLVIIA